MTICAHGGGLKAIADEPHGASATADRTFTVFANHGKPAKALGLTASIKDREVTITVPDSEKGCFPEATAIFGYSRMFEKASSDDIPSEEDLIELGGQMARLRGNQCSLGGVPAGYTYFGQFLAHEMTGLCIKRAGDEVINLRTATLDLDSVFWPDRPPASMGDGVHIEAGVAIGPTAPPLMSKWNDLPRYPCGTPVIPDERNDSNLALAQLHVMIVKFHQYMARQHPDDARKRTTICVQEVALFDFLKKLIDCEVYCDILQNGRKLIETYGIGPKDNYLLPIEFAAACFRFGHSMVRDKYAWNNSRNATTHSLLDNTLLGNGLTDGPPRRLAERWAVDWSKMMPLSGSEPAGHDVSAAIDLYLAPALFEIPNRWFSTEDLPSLVNLATHTLMRGRTFSIPSAQSILKCVHAELDEGSVKPTPLGAEEIANVPIEELRTLLLRGEEPHRLVDRTPLWFYTLREAQEFHDGKRLGPLASRIVMETIHAAIEASGTGLIHTNQMSEGGCCEDHVAASHCTLFDLVETAGKWQRQNSTEH